MLAAEGVGEVVRDGNCPRLKNNPNKSHWSAMIWPAGFVPHVHQGAVEIHGSRVIAQVGDEITGGGEYSDRASGERSRPVVLRASNI